MIICRSDSGAPAGDDEREDHHECQFIYQENIKVNSCFYFHYFILFMFRSPGKISYASSQTGTDDGNTYRINLGDVKRSRIFRNLGTKTSSNNTTTTEVSAPLTVTTSSKSNIITRYYLSDKIIEDLEDHDNL